MKVVTALITNINQRSDRNIERYINYGSVLIQSKASMFIFMEPHVYDNNRERLGLIGCAGSGSFWYSIDTKYPHRFVYYDYIVNGYLKRIILFEKDNIYLYNYRDYATNFYVHTENVLKDTIEYMFVQCHKTEWMNMAIECDTEKSPTDSYVWMDFGIFHMFADNQVDFYAKIENLLKRDAFSEDADKVRFASCWEPLPYYLDIYKDISWLFAGSIFGGSTRALKRLAIYMRHQCIDIMKKRATLMWEVNVWSILYDKCPDLFELYRANHDGTIFGITEYKEASYNA